MIKRKYILESGIIVLVFNALWLHFFYTDTDFQNKFYFISDCVGRSLVLIGIPIRSRIVKIGIGAEIARLCYNTGWAFGFYEVYSLKTEYFVPIIIFAIFVYLDKYGTNRSR